MTNYYHLLIEEPHPKAVGPLDEETFTKRKGLLYNSMGIRLLIAGADCNASIHIESLSELVFTGIFIEAAGLRWCNLN